jgi:hypothetical protein
VTTEISIVDYPENGPEVSASLQSTISGEDADNNRLVTYELWNYGEDNIGPTSAAVKAAAGVLGVAQVLVADATETVTFYDAAAALEGGEIVLGIMALDTVGTQIYFRRPASVGIWAEFSSGTDTGVVAVGYL